MMRLFSKKHAKTIRFILRVIAALIANILIVGWMIAAQNPGIFAVLFQKRPAMGAPRAPAIIGIFFAYFIRYIAAILIVAIVVYYLVRKHKEESVVRFDTYVDMELFNKFNVLDSGILPEERIYWQAQRNIEKKMKEQGNNYQVAQSGAAVYSDSDEPKEEIPLPVTGSPEDLDPEMNPEMPIPSYKNDHNGDQNDPLADIPEFDPTGPDPFK